MRKGESSCGKRRGISFLGGSYIQLFTDNLRDSDPVVKSGP